MSSEFDLTIRERGPVPLEEDEMLTVVLSVAAEAHKVPADKASATTTSMYRGPGPQRELTEHAMLLSMLGYSLNSHICMCVYATGVYDDMLASSCMQPAMLQNPATFRVRLAGTSFVIVCYAEQS